MGHEVGEFGRLRISDAARESWEEEWLSDQSMERCVRAKGAQGGCRLESVAGSLPEGGMEVAWLGDSPGHLLSSASARFLSAASAVN
jgi:hypothetical protein